MDTAVEGGCTRKVLSKLVTSEDHQPSSDDDDDATLLSLKQSHTNKKRKQMNDSTSKTAVGTRRSNRERTKKIIKSV